MNYYLMRKDKIITKLLLNEDGELIKYDYENLNVRLAPLHQEANRATFLRIWWNNRCNYMTGIHGIIKDKGFEHVAQYVIKHLAVSLNDCYWIKPIESELVWTDVNPYINAFSDDILGITNMKEYGYSPNPTLVGMLEKTWKTKGSDRILVKGNCSDTSIESINETIATEIHKRQGYDNFVVYSLLPVNKKDYNYVCTCKCFTNEDVELVTAYEVISSKKKPNNISLYEHFILVCAEHGMDEEQLRRDLEYQIMTDYLITNIDRHLSNIGILRDTNTLEFIRMAPIFDSGKSLLASTSDISEKALNKLEVTSFAKKEKTLLSYVQNWDILNIAKLPDANFIVDQYKKDSKVTERMALRAGQLYEYKKKQLLEFQHKSADIETAIQDNVDSDIFMQEFETFKSNIRNIVAQDEMKFLRNELKNDTVTYYINIGKLYCGLYILGMIDYLCRKHNLPTCAEYATIRNQTYSKLIFPLDAYVEMITWKDKKKEITEKYLRNAEPEFLRLGIVEGMIEDELYHS